MKSKIQNQKFKIGDRVILRAVLAGTLALLFRPLPARSAENFPAPAHERIDATPAQWRLIWTADPAREALLSWSTARPGSRHLVHFDTQHRAGQSDGHAKSVECFRNGRYENGSEPIELYFHHARLRDLEPDTTYYVVMESDGKRSPEFRFRTAPDRDVPIRVLFGGDSRSDRAARRAVNAMIARMVAEDDSILAFAHGGDYIATGTNLGQWSVWMTDHELTVAQDRLLPIIPARGNHDRGPLFDQVFGFPPGDKNYYGVSLTPKCRLVTLNTETSIAGDQADWLAEELARWRPTARWLFAQYHRPAWPAVKFPSTALVHWVPLFEEFDVDLVCEADGHNIKRTVPIRDKQQDPSGIVYIGEGGLGVGQREPKTDRWYLKPPGIASRGHHVQLLTFALDQMVVEVVRLEGDVFDRYERAPRAIAVGAK